MALLRLLVYVLALLGEEAVMAATLMFGAANFTHIPFHAYPMLGTHVR